MSWIANCHPNLPVQWQAIATGCLHLLPKYTSPQLLPKAEKNNIGFSICYQRAGNGKKLFITDIEVAPLAISPSSVLTILDKNTLKLYTVTGFEALSLIHIVPLSPLILVSICLQHRLVYSSVFKDCTQKVLFSFPHVYNIKWQHPFTSFS